ncbi:MAG: MFS transporter [Alicyclobacillus sp.]|nr:MFS transporter [Alicyclobacillus sp.]
MKQKAAWVPAILLCLVPWLMVLGNSVLIPGLPEMAERMHVTRLQISLLITLFSLPAGLVIPFAGMLSDRFGRRWVVVPSLLLFGIGGLVAGLAGWWMRHPYGVVLAGRVLQGIGAAGTAPIAMAWIGDLYRGAQRARVLGVNEAGNALGKVMSPIVGSAVGLLAWFAVFFVFPVLCVPLTVLIWRLVPAEREAKSPRAPAEDADSSRGSYLHRLREVFRREGRWLSIAYLGGAAALFTLFGVLFYLSDLLERSYGIDGLRKGLVLAIPLFVLTGTSIATGMIIRKRVRRMKWMLVGGLCVMAAGLILGGWLANRAWPLVGALSVSALGTGCVLPSLNMLITSAVNRDLRGVVTSLYGSVRFLGVAAGPPAVTFLMRWPRLVLFGALAALCLVCAALAVWLIRPASEPRRGGSASAWASSPRPLRGSTHRKGTT